ncbi:MAG: 30S ribosomal protein S17 [Bacillota bacterium]
MEERSKRKERVGFVVSNKMDKTVSVEVERKTQHPLYKRVISQTKKYKAHDENNECNEGDKVLITETRPLSKTKRWRVKEIIRKAK